MNIMSLAAEVATARIVDGIADLHLILDEAIFQVDEVDDDEAEKVGKKQLNLSYNIFDFFHKMSILKIM